MGLIFLLFLTWWFSVLVRSARRGGVLELLLATLRSGVAHRCKRHHSNGFDRILVTAAWHFRIAASSAFLLLFFYILLDSIEIEDHHTSTIISSRHTSFSLSFSLLV